MPQNVEVEMVENISAAEKYRTWKQQKSQIKIDILQAFNQFEIFALEVRVDNFIAQLGSDLEKAALEEMTAD